MVMIRPGETIVSIVRVRKEYRVMRFQNMGQATILVFGLVSSAAGCNP